MFKVLVVDDDPPIVKFCSRILKAAGLGVSEATTSDKALAVARKELPDLLLTDLNLPEMDGIALIEQVRSIPGLETIGVIAMSGEPRLRAEVLGDVEAVLAKPFSPQELIDHVRRAAAKTKTRLRLPAYRGPSRKNKVPTERIS